MLPPVILTLKSTLNPTLVTTFSLEVMVLLHFFPLQGPRAPPKVLGLLHSRWSRWLSSDMASVRSWAFACLASQRRRPGLGFFLGGFSLLGFWLDLAWLGLIDFGLAWLDFGWIST